jgi:hypothetical protein
MNNRDSCFDTTYMFSPESTHAVQFDCLTKGQYLQDTVSLLVWCNTVAFTLNRSQRKTTQISTVTISGEDTPSLSVRHCHQIKGCFWLHRLTGDHPSI